MKQRGRKSKDSVSAELVVLEGLSTVRPTAPEELTDAEKQRWSRITASKAVDFFDNGVVDLLTEYCRLKTQVDLVSKEIEVYDPAWLETDKGVARYKNLAGIRDQGQGRMLALARAMRLTNQSRFQPVTAGSRSGKGKSNEHLWKRS